MGSLGAKSWKRNFAMKKNKFVWEPFELSTEIDMKIIES
jgi:hypothetical protein